MFKRIVLILLTAISFTSCKLQDDITYLQNIDELADQLEQEDFKTLIEEDDQLRIEVSGEDEDMIGIFNQNFSSYQLGRFDEASINKRQSTNREVAPLYQVDSKGYIDFPLLGKVKVAGLTVEEINDNLGSQVEEYIKKPTVSVRLENFKVTVLGEVSKPGRYTVPEGKTSLLDALGMAGDATKYGLRENVLLLRKENGQVSRHRVDLTEADFISSSYYYLKQNDVVYVAPNKAYKDSSNYAQQTSVYISAASLIVTVLTLIFK